jgi:hypothetical protein
MSEGFNKDKWILYFFDDVTRINFVYTLLIKSLLPDLVKKFIVFVRRYYKYKVKTFRINNETSLKKRFIT